MQFFEESLISKINKSALQTKKIPTPLLNSKEFQYKDIYTVPSPDSSLLASDGIIKFFF